MTSHIYRPCCLEECMSTGLVAAEACGLALGYVLHRRASAAATAKMEKQQTVCSDVLRVIELHALIHTTLLREKVMELATNVHYFVSVQCTLLREKVMELATNVLLAADEAVFAVYWREPGLTQVDITVVEKLTQGMDTAPLICMLFRRVPEVFMHFIYAYEPNAHVDVQQLCVLARAYLQAREDMLCDWLSHAAKLVQFLMVVFWQSIRFSAEARRPTHTIIYEEEEQLFAQFFSRGIAALPKRFDMVAWNDWNEKKPNASEA